MDRNQELINTFLAISSIPRSSGEEAALREELIANANSLGLPYKQDETGNLAIFLPPTPGMEKAPGILVQAHMDMVCVADANIEHDFRTDLLQVSEQDGWFSAAGTSLGADNGVGCAIAMSLAREKDLKHGPLELLFSVEEETGMRGMQNLPPEFIDPNTKFAINLDFEAEDYICIGGAGGILISAEARFPVKVNAGDQAKDFSVWRLRAYGVQGGHSGIDIEARPGNLHHHLFQMIDQLHACLMEYEGGEAINTIPSWANLAIAVPGGDDGAVRDELVHCAKAFSALYAHTGGSPVLEFELLPRIHSGQRTEFLSRELTAILTGTIHSLPNGVVSRHAELGGSPRSSANLGTLRLSESGHLQIGIGLRADDEAEASSLKDFILEHLRQLPDVSFKMDGYPAWQPQPDAPLIRHCQDARKGLFPGEATLISVHAGIECSLLAAKRPGLQVVSIGPNITGAHSTRERVSIISMSRVYAWLQAIIREIGSLTG